MRVGDKNITNVPMVDSKKIVFSSLHIELGLFKKFIKALYKEGNCFQYIKDSLPSANEEKLNAGVFDDLKLEN